VNVCVLVPCFNEERYLPEFIKGLKRQSILQEDGVRVIFLIIDGGSQDGSRGLLEALSKDFEILQLIDNPERFVSNGLNAGIEYGLNWGADYFVRMDLHAEYPDYYISELVARSTAQSKSGVNLGNYGGVVDTVAPDSSLKAAIIAKALASRFGVGGSLFRVGTSKIQSVDTVPFGCFPRKVFLEVGRFDTELIRNQDDEFNGRLKNAGYDILLDPGIVVKYFPRADFSRLGRMFYQYGYFKPFVNKKLGQPAAYRQFAPPILVVSLLFSFLMVGFTVLPLFLLLGAYCSFCVAFYLVDVRSSSCRGVRAMSLAVQSLAVVHLSYGSGYCVGQVRSLVGMGSGVVGSSR